jgi:hypothetical protein
MVQPDLLLKLLHVVTVMGPHKLLALPQRHPEGGEITTNNAFRVSN